MKRGSSRSYKKRHYWESHFKNWQASTLSQAQYCRQNELSSKSFTYWKGKLSRPDEEIRFVPVPFVADQPKKFGTRLNVVVNDRYLIEVGDGFTPETLKQVLRVLEAAR